MSNNKSNKLQTKDIKPISMASYLPEYKKHIHPCIMVCGDYVMSGVKLFGSSFQTIDDDILHSEFAALARNISNLGKDFGSSLSIWASIIKSKDVLKSKFHYDNIFLQEFTNSYLDGFKKLNFYKTEYFLTFGLKIHTLDDAIQDMITILRSVEAQINNKYNGSIFQVKTLENNSSNSALASFLYMLINGEYRDMPLCSQDYKDILVDSDIYFNYDFFEQRNRYTGNKKFGVTYDLKGYSHATKEAMFDFLLDISYEFIFTQSLTFISAQRSLKMIDEQKNKLRSVSDSALEFSDELDIGKAAVQEGLFSFINYHSSIRVYGDSPKQAIENGTKVTTQFNTIGSFTWERATYDSYISFFSHLPLSKFRPNQSIRTTANFVCCFSLHNYFFGKPLGNPIGDGTAIMPMKTKSNGLYHFNFHSTDLNKDVRGQPIAGHTMILGATGWGKTTLEATILSFVQRFYPKMFVIDFNRSTELYMRAFGAEYFAIKAGEYIGLNPFQLEKKPSEKLRLFLYELSYACAKDIDGKVSDLHKKMLNQAVDSVLDLPLEIRRFSMLLQSISDDDLKVRLEKWCTNDEGVKGQFAWAIDSPTNIFNPLEFNKIGFDTTVILEANNALTEIVLGILFFYKELMQQDGKMLLTVVEEFHKACHFELTARPIKDALKAGRLRGEIVLLISQSPEDALKSPIAVAMIEQTPTKVLLGNPYATTEQYKAIGCTLKECKTIKNFQQEDRFFLIKQGNNSVVAKLDLSSSIKYLPIISGSTLGVIEFEKLTQTTGKEPNNWTMQFLEIMSNL